MAIEKKKVIDIETGKAQTGVRNLKQEIRELRQAMAGMEEGSEEWAQASQQLASALDKQRKIAEAGKFATQDFGNMMGNLSSVAAGAVAGINGITSALNLMGVEMDKDDIGMIKFTQSMMAIVQALSAVDTAQKAWKGLVSGLNALLDKKLADTAETVANTAATQANTEASLQNAAAKQKEAAATAENAAAKATDTAAQGANAQKAGNLTSIFSKLGKVIKTSAKSLTIWGAALAALIAIIAKAAKNASEARKKEQELLDIQNKMNEATVTAGALLREYDATLHDSNASYEQRMNALQHLKDAFPEYKAQLTEEGKLIKDNNEYLKANIDLIEQKAVAAALEDDYIEALKEQRRLNQEIADIEAGRNTTWAQRFFFGDIFNGGSMETTDPLSKWLFGKGQESRIDDRKEDLEEVERKLQNIRKEFKGVSAEMATTRIAASWKDNNIQIEQFRRTAEKTARVLSQMYAELKLNLLQFQSGTDFTAFQEFTNTINAQLTAMGKNAGEILGEDFVNAVNDTLLAMPDLVESNSKVFNETISKAFEQAGGDAENFFELLEEGLTSLGEGQYADKQLANYFNSLRQVLTGFVEDGDRLSQTGMFNPKFIANLEKKLQELQAQYVALGGSVSGMSETVAQKNQKVINDWNDENAKIWEQMGQLRRGYEEAEAGYNAALQRQAEKADAIRSQVGKTAWQIQQELDALYSGFDFDIDGSVGYWEKKMNDASDALRRFSEENHVNYEEMKKQHESVIQAADALNNYMLQMAQANDRNARLGMTKETLEGYIEGINAMIEAYKKLQTSQQDAFKGAYDFYVKIIPSMVERIRLEREFIDARTAGDRNAENNRNLQILELERTEIEQNLEYWKKYQGYLNTTKEKAQQNITDLQAQLDGFKKQVEDGTMTNAEYLKKYQDIIAEINMNQQVILGFSKERIEEINNGIVNAQQKLAEKTIEIDNEMYAQRTNNLNYWWDNLMNEYDAAYDQLETVMLEHRNLWSLGTEDYNTEMEELEAQKYFLEQKMAQLDSWREQDLINELDYLEKKKELDQQYANIDVKMTQETSNRKLKIFNTYYNGIKSITGAINGILSQAIEAESENKEKQKELRIAQTWMTGIMGSIEALVSGIQSGIPAPGNFILGAALSALTLTETAMAAANIRKESGSAQTSGAANINVPTYETMAYEQSANIEGSITDQRVVVVESDIQAVSSHVDVIESEASF